MKRFTSIAALALGVFGLEIPHAQAGDFTLFRNIWGEVLVSTDMTDAGRALPLPTQENPVYFLGRSLGCKLGSIRGDHLPDEQKMNQFVTRVLAKQGYLGARKGTPDPALFLVVQWGYLEPRSGDLMWFLGYDANKDIASPSFPGRLGPEVFLRNFRSHVVETILESANDPIYGIIVTAFDFKTADTASPVIYWQTRIGLPANGKSMAEALPTMFAAAAPTIGHETDTPVLRDADTARKGHIRLGDLEILDMTKEPSSLNKPPGEKP